MAYNKETGMWEGFIYKIYNTNRMTDKVYVGQTILDLEQRWKQHKYRSGIKRYTNIILYNTIKKYGIDNFDICMIEIVSHKNKTDMTLLLNEKEKYYINYYNSIQPSGLNITAGGDYNPTIVTIKPIWQYDKNEVFIREFESAEAAYRHLGKNGSSISSVCKGKKGCVSYCGYLWNYKIDGIDPQLVPYKEAKVLYKEPEKIKRKPITSTKRARYNCLYKFDLDGNLLSKYDNVLEACIDNEIKDPNRIYDICKTKHGAYKGFLWSKTIEPSQYNPIQPWCKKVEQYGLDGNYIAIFNSMVEASISIFGTKSNCSNISSVCRGTSKTCGGYIWKYAS